MVARRVTYTTLGRLFCRGLKCKKKKKQDALTGAYSHAVAKSLGSQAEARAAEKRACLPGTVLRQKQKKTGKDLGMGMPALDPSNAGADLVGLVGAIFSFCFARTNDIASMTEPVRHKEASAGGKKEGSSMTGPRLSWFCA